MSDSYSHLLHHLIQNSAGRTPDAAALQCKNQVLSYASLWSLVQSCAGGLDRIGLQPNERVAIYLPKQMESVIAAFGVTAAGGVFVPINFHLKPRQVAHILQDCNVRVLVTSAEPARQLSEVLPGCRDLRHLVLVNGSTEHLPAALQALCMTWVDLMEADLEACPPANRIDTDMAAILYTSGSTGLPKGVVLSHRNMLAGAASVSEYLQNSPSERILAVLPFSFDYGFSQLTTAFLVGGCVIMMDYLLPGDVLKAVERHRITGLAAVPPLWNQLAPLAWPESARRSLRYITSSGGVMPKETSRRLQAALPDTQIFLMYGLTEAFRSTYLPPSECATRPDSIGKAIPNADIMVVREDGSECGPDEPGELVHRGALVAMGYWNDPANTAQRFKPAPGQPAELSHPEIAVWSGDQVRKDPAGYLYFVSRKDDMIKTSGYRISPTEIEQVVYALAGVEQAVALGIEHPLLGQAIVLVVQDSRPEKLDEQQVQSHCRAELPAFMLPARIEIRSELPRNPNGKIDRPRLHQEFQDCFHPDSTLDRPATR